MPAMDAVGVKATSRPSTNESAAANTQTAAGAAKGKRRRASSGSATSAIAGTVNQRVVLGACAASSLERDLERHHERGEHDQQVEPVPAREGPDAAHALNVLHAPRAPPPTGSEANRRPVRARIRLGDEAARRRAHSVGMRQST